MPRQDKLVENKYRYDYNVIHHSQASERNTPKNRPGGQKTSLEIRKRTRLEGFNEHGGYP